MWGHRTSNIVDDERCSVLSAVDDENEPWKVNELMAEVKVAKRLGRLCRYCELRSGVAGRA